MSWERTTKMLPFLLTHANEPNSFPNRKEMLLRYSVHIPNAFFRSVERHHGPRRKVSAPRWWRGWQTSICTTFVCFPSWISSFYLTFGGPEVSQGRESCGNIFLTWGIVYAWGNLVQSGGIFFTLEESSFTSEEYPFLELGRNFSRFSFCFAWESKNN